MAEQIKVGHFRELCRTALDSKGGALYILTKDSLKVIDLTSFKLIENSAIQAPDGMRMEDLIPVCLNKNFYLINNQGGQVYCRSKSGFDRLDRSFTHKMQIGSVVFTHDGKIFRYGGYGFWSFRNFFTYFDIQTHEWEIIEPIGSTTFPQGCGMGSIVKIIGDDWYVIGGKTNNQAVPLQLVFNTECWVFHSKTKTWEQKGPIKFASLNTIIASIDFDDQLLMITGAKTYLLNLKNNLATTYINTPFVNGIRSTLSDYNSSYYYNGIFYLLHASASNDPNNDIIRVDKMMIDPIGKSEVYGKNSYRIVYLAFVAAILSGILYLFWIRKKRIFNKKIKVVDGKLVFKSKSVELDSFHIGLLRLFLNSQDLTTNDILSYIQNDHLHYTQNLRIINNMVDKLNFNFNLLTGHNLKLIQMKKSADDMRIKVFTIQKFYFYE
ncbi:MAG: hypothetical protein WCL21_09205 [Mariniphaga sp.]